MNLFFYFLKKLPGTRIKRKNSSLERKKYLALKKSAETLIKKRVLEINEFYGFPYGKITIRNQKTRWGSCSKKGNLNFNYKIALLPRIYMDYVISHELCHLKEFNHSKNFWKLVEQTVPDYKKIRKIIRKLDLSVKTLAKRDGSC